MKIAIQELRDRKKVGIRTFTRVSEAERKVSTPTCSIFGVFVLANGKNFSFFQTSSFLIYKVISHAYSHRRLTTIHFYHSNVYKGNLRGS